MGQEGHFVVRLDLPGGGRQRCRGIAFLARLRAGLLHTLLENFGQRGGAHGGHGTFVPLHVQHAPSLHGAPGIVGHHSHAAGYLHDEFHAGHGLRLGGVEALDLAAENGTARHHGIHHPRQTDVDAELRAAVHFGRRVQALDRLADEPELRGILEGRIRRHRQFGCVLGQAAVGHPRGGGVVDHRAVLRAAHRGIHAPYLRRRLHEHFARRGAGAAQRIEGGPHARAAEHALHGSVLAVHPGKLRADLLPVAFQFLGEEHGERGDGSLPHLRLVNEKRHDIVRAHVDEGIELGGCGRRGFLGAELKTDQHAAGGGSARPQESAAADILRRAHRTPALTRSSAAR